MPVSATYSASTTFLRVQFDGPLAIGTHASSQWNARINNHLMAGWTPILTDAAGTETKVTPGDLSFGPNTVTYTAAVPTIRDTFGRLIAGFFAFPVTIIA